MGLGAVDMADVNMDTSVERDSLDGLVDELRYRLSVMVTVDAQIEFCNKQIMELESSDDILMKAFVYALKKEKKELELKQLDNGELDDEIVEKLKKEMLENKEEFDAMLNGKWSKQLKYFQKNGFISMSYSKGRVTPSRVVTGILDIYKTSAKKLADFSDLLERLRDMEALDKYSFSSYVRLFLMLGNTVELTKGLKIRLAKNQEMNGDDLIDQASIELGDYLSEKKGDAILNRKGLEGVEFNNLLKSVGFSDLDIKILRALNLVTDDARI